MASDILSNPRVHPDDVRQQVVRRLIREERLNPDVAARLGAAPVETGWRESIPDPTLFRGRIRALRVTARSGRGPQTLLLVDLDYACAVQETEEASRVIDHGDVITGVASVLEAWEPGTVETGVSLVGEHVLDSFPAIREVTVSITDQGVLEAHEVSDFEVMRTFRR